MANYPVSVITDGMGLNITVMSYCGHLDFGIVADRDQMPDVADLMGWLDAELRSLRPRHVRSRPAVRGARPAGNGGPPQRAKAQPAKRRTQAR